MNKYLFFTQCYVRELPSVKRLHASLRKHDESVNFLAVLVDDATNIPAGFSFDFEIIGISEMQLGVFDELCTRYNWNELRDNCKPFVVSHLLQKNESVVYIDPTTIFYNSPEIFSETLEKSNAFWVPQLLFAHQHPKENDALNWGIYHNGTMGFRISHTTDKLLAWWQQHTRFKGFIDSCKGMNTDRLCLELAPILFENTTVLKHPGVNIGEWNTKERRIRGFFGNKTVANQPLISTNFKYKSVRDVSFAGITPAFGLYVRELTYAERNFAPILKQILKRIDAFFNQFYVYISA